MSRQPAVPLRAGLLTARRRGRYPLDAPDRAGSARLGPDLPEAVPR
ncbi:hypothetical protein ACFWP2_14305 [Kitasatospora sp. NPDC058444]